MTNTQSTTDLTIDPFAVAIDQADLDDLHRRLDRTRYADQLAGDGWAQGTPVEHLRDTVAAWLDFDWRAVEERLNAYPQFRTRIDGQTIHFLHIRSAHEDATPLLSPTPTRGRCSTSST